MQLTTIMILLSLTLLQDHDRSALMKSLADAERAFAAMSVAQGAREAFLAHFAEDGIAFQPHPVVYRKVTLNRPAPPDPKAFTLDWSPLVGDVSESGDLGYTTGPFSLVDNSGKQASRYGFYFSVWKRDSALTWKVALDIGIRTSKEFDGTGEFRQASPVKREAQQKDNVKSGKDELSESEEKYFSLAATGGVQAAYEDVLSFDCRVHLDGHQPLVGRPAITEFFSGRGEKRSGRVLFAAIARSNDLGYSYGSYEVIGSGKTTERGYFGHVWKRNELNEWKLVAEILSPAPLNSP